MAAVGETSLRVPDSGEAVGLFDRGRVVGLDGNAVGAVALVKRDLISGASREIELWQAMRLALSPGDRVRIVAGCDKRAATCKKKFQNFINFRGFPHIPGEDWLTAYPKQDGDNDGGSLNG